MLEVIKTEQGEIKAVCEYYIVDGSGNYDTQGEFVWINEVDISSQYRNNGLLKEFVRAIIKKVPSTARFGYFWRQGKYPNRKMRIWHKEKWLRLIK